MKTKTLKKLFFLSAFIIVFTACSKEPTVNLLTDSIWKSSDANIKFKANKIELSDEEIKTLPTPDMEKYLKEMGNASSYFPMIESQFTSGVLNLKITEDQFIVIVDLSVFDSDTEIPMVGIAFNYTLKKSKLTLELSDNLPSILADKLLGGEMDDDDDDDKDNPKNKHVKKMVKEVNKILSLQEFDLAFVGKNKDKLSLTADLRNGLAERFINNDFTVGQIMKFIEDLDGKKGGGDEEEVPVEKYNEAMQDLTKTIKKILKAVTECSIDIRFNRN